MKIKTNESPSFEYHIHIAKSRSADNKDALKKILFDDILRSIKENMRLGNLTVSDAQLLISYTQKLYDHLYSHYEEMEDITNMTDESFMTDADLIVKGCEEKFARQLAEKDAIHQKELAEKDQLIASLQAQLNQMNKN